MSAPPSTLATSLAILRWLARIGSIASALVIALFFVGEGFIPADVAAREWLGLLFFPVGVLAGMALAWWREALGGALAVASLLAFYFLYGLLLTGGFPRGGAFLLLASPGLLFLLYGLLSHLSSPRMCLPPRPARERMPPS
ncbi:MAG: hypothetical protein V2A58_09240 [Planctomycetota bacterium]